MKKTFIKFRICTIVSIIKYISKHYFKNTSYLCWTKMHTSKPNIQFCVCTLYCRISWELGWVTTKLDFVCSYHYFMCESAVSNFTVTNGERYASRLRLLGTIEQIHLYSWHHSNMANLTLEVLIGVVCLLPGKYCYSGHRPNH